MQLISIQTTVIKFSSNPIIWLQYLMYKQRKNVISIKTRPIICKTILERYRLENAKIWPKIYYVKILIVFFWNIFSPTWIVFNFMIRVSIGIPMMLCSSNHKQAWDTSWFIIVRFWGSMVNFSYTTTRVSSPLPTISTIVAKSTEGALRLFYHFRGFPDWIFIFV